MDLFCARVKHELHCLLNDVDFLEAVINGKETPYRDKVINEQIGKIADVLFKLHMQVAEEKYNPGGVE